MSLHAMSPAALTGFAAAGFVAMYALGYVVIDWLVVRTLIAMAWVATFGLLAWFRLDETAREAHKFAWFWGGGLGLLLMMISIVGVIWSPDAWSGLAVGVSGLNSPASATMPAPLGGFVIGLMACALAQVIGYAIVWSAWWLRRR